MGAAEHPTSRFGHSHDAAPHAGHGPDATPHAGHGPDAGHDPDAAPPAGPGHDAAPPAGPGHDAAPHAGHGPDAGHDPDAAPPAGPSHDAAPHPGPGQDPAPHAGQGQDLAAHAGHGRHARHDDAPDRSHSHSHGHAVSAHTDQRYVAGALALIVSFMVGEVVAAVLAGSLALLADAGHMLTDAGALGLSMWAMRLSARPAAGTMTFGFKRAEILSAMANGATLLAISVVVTVEAAIRLAHPSGVDGATVIVVAAVGVAVNAAATTVLARADRTSLNIAGAFAHLVTDAWAFAATLVAGIVVVTTGFLRADAVASLLTVVLMVRAGLGLMRSSGRVLLEAAPESVDLQELRAHLLTLPHVTAVHDLHAWVVTSDLPAVSAHVVVSDACFVEGRSPRLLDELQACLAGHFDVTHSTFQIEPAGHAAHEAAHHHD